MKFRSYYISLLLFLLSLGRVNGQVDETPPEAPLLDLVSVVSATGNVEISWMASPSTDVAGYVIYRYENNRGFELDTIYDPSARYYLRTGSGSVYYSESFVVAAIDSSGNTSPLSNVLSTIFTSAQIDTCNRRIDVMWSSYSPAPREVSGYTVLFSIDGGLYSEAREVRPDKINVIIDGFDVNKEYCFIVRANLSGGVTSGSNKACLITGMQRPPDWINADYATVATGGDIMLSFTPDPDSEIDTYVLERKTGSAGAFVRIWQFNDLSGQLLYNDADAETDIIYYYRLKAINNCDIPIVISNTASNMVLAADNNEGDIRLVWNPYREWRGIVSTQNLYMSTGASMEERLSVPPGDSILIMDYSDLMYEVAGDEVCFMIKAIEGSNPYSINGESMSSIACIPVFEKIFVPNIFTPDFNSVNDFFKPVLSFTPQSYKLYITDFRRKAVFETTDFNKEWDGTNNGTPLPEGVYLWFLNVRSPSGKEFFRTGTVTIKHNR